MEQIYIRVRDLRIPTDFFIFLPTMTTAGTRTRADIYIRQVRTEVLKEKKRGKDGAVELNIKEKDSP